MQSVNGLGCTHIAMSERIAADPTGQTAALGRLCLIRARSTLSRLGWCETGSKTRTDSVVGVAHDDASPPRPVCRACVRGAPRSCGIVHLCPRGRQAAEHGFRRARGQTVR
jgi:hypothetical protein